VARCESFIAGWGLDHMMQRAEAYSKAGADAILCHSKRSDSSEIQAFMKAWKEHGNKTPVVIVPTKYYTTPSKDFQDWGVSMVIWANHNLRYETRSSLPSHSPRAQVTHRHHR
jgi:phosphoenolpyruvate phosphomutase